MSSTNIINKAIKNNFSIKDDSCINNEIKSQKIDSSFNQLLSLQLLVQKHSGLKDLCKNKY
jgi:hypothetical protein